MTETAEPRVQLVRRAARLAAPPVPEGTVSVSPPPRVDSQPAGAVGWMQYLFPVVGSLGGMLFILNNPKPLFLASGVLFMAGSIGMGAGMAVQQRLSTRRRRHAARARYLEYLRGVPAPVESTAAAQPAATPRRPPA